MRKAFDANVPRTRPKLRLGALTATAVAEHEALELEASVAPPFRPFAPAAPEPETAPAHESEALAAEAAAIAHQVAQIAHAVATDPDDARSLLRREPTLSAVASDAAPVGEVELDPRERRERLRERLKAATAPVALSAPTPASPTEARASALALVGALRQELEDTRALNTALTRDLEQVRAELGRSAEEARSGNEQAQRMVSEVAERAALVEELGGEMESLEAERDDALVELRSARAEMNRQIEGRKALEAQLAQAQSELSETLTEEERLASELEQRVGELRRTENALDSLTAERDGLARQVADLTRERASLLVSQKALDEIHCALSDARSRAGSR